MQKKSNCNSGITLIALIITIIVMIILVAVTVNTAVNSGLFGHAGNATKRWAEEQEKESKVGNDGYITETVSKYSKNIKIGDYVDYTPDPAENYMGLTEETTGSTQNLIDGYPQDKSLKWRIWSVNDDGSIELISSEATSTYMFLKGALGYNNGVFLINDLCKKQYSNSNLGAVGRNLNLEDIENKMNEKGINARNSWGVSDNVRFPYGSFIKLTEKEFYVPDIYKYMEEDETGKSLQYYETPTKNKMIIRNSLQTKQTYYVLASEAEFYREKIIHELIFPETKRYYILTSRSIAYFSTEDGIAFGINGIDPNKETLTSFRLVTTSFTESEHRDRVRPIVKLPSNIELSEEGGTADNPKTISVK